MEKEVWIDNSIDSSETSVYNGLQLTRTCINKLQMKCGKIGYALDFNNGIRTTTANAQQIWSATRDVYQEFGLSQYLDILKDELIAAGHNLDWGAPLK